MRENPNEEFNFSWDCPADGLAGWGLPETGGSAPENSSPILTGCAEFITSNGVGIYDRSPGAKVDDRVDSREQ